MDPASPQQAAPETSVSAREAAFDPSFRSTASPTEPLSAARIGGGAEELSAGASPGPPPGRLALPRDLLVALLVCSGLLVAAECLSRWAVPRLAVSPGYYDSGAMKALAARDRRGRHVVWLIGDSTVVGLDVRRDQTLGARLDKRLRERFPGWEARAVGFGGIGLTNDMEIARELPLERGDVAIFPIHLLYAANRADIGEGLRGPESGAGWRERVETNAKKPFVRCCGLVRNQRYLSRLPALLAQEQLLPEKIAKLMRRTKSGPQRMREWTSGAITPEDLKNLTRRYSAVDGRRVPRVLKILVDIHRQLEQQGVLLATYVSPLNRAIVERYRYADWGRLVSVGRSICAASTRAGVECLNLVDAVPGELFYDDDHPQPEGYRIEASQLTRYLERLLEVQEAKRHLGKAGASGLSKR